MKNLAINIFTDPMMGLSYESEPFIRKLETHFQKRIDFKYVMSVLVRDVYDFVDPEDLVVGKEFALKRYNARLAKIYEDEECISGMPISMPNLHLFSVEHTSSMLLNLAVKAAELADPSKAALFLYNLRFATIVECKPTLRLEETMVVADRTFIDRGTFVKHYHDGSAQVALDADFLLREKFGVRKLPAYLFEYGDRYLLVSGVLDYSGFLSAISKITNGELLERPPEASTQSIQQLIHRHPLISPIEIKDAFGLNSISQVERLIQPLLDTAEIRTITVPHGWFIQKVYSPC